MGMSPMMEAGMTPPNADRKYPAEVLTADEVQALMGACSARSASGIRNRALIALQWAFGYLTYNRGARLITGQYKT